MLVRTLTWAVIVIAALILLVEPIAKSVAVASARPTLHAAAAGNRAGAPVTPFTPIWTCNICFYPFHIKI